jgi:hypothetical protein
MLKEHRAAKQDKSKTSAVRLGDRDDLVELPFPEQAPLEIARLARARSGT